MSWTIVNYQENAVWRDRQNGEVASCKITLASGIKVADVPSIDDIKALIEHDLPFLETDFKSNAETRLWLQRNRVFLAERGDFFDFQLTVNHGKWELSWRSGAPIDLAELAEKLP